MTVLVQPNGSPGGGGGGGGRTQDFDGGMGAGDRVIQNN